MKCSVFKCVIGAFIYTLGMYIDMPLQALLALSDTCRWYQCQPTVYWQSVCIGCDLWYLKNTQLCYLICLIKWFQSSYTDIFLLKRDSLSHHIELLSCSYLSYSCTNENKNSTTRHTLNAISKCYVQKYTKTSFGIMSSQDLIRLVELTRNAVDSVNK